MALRRKRRFDSPVRCAICKQTKAYHTIHGHSRYGGNSCCNDCYLAVKAKHEEDAAKEHAYEETEADYQISRYLR